jgi:GNAT superfamily N-acetyltransferase
MFDIRQASTDRDWREAAALLHDHVEWMRGHTGFDPVAEQPELATELSRVAEHYGSADGTLFLAEWHSISVGTVAIRDQHDGSAELKRMYVRPVARGRGVADGLLAAAVADAAERGCRTVWLETVRGPMDRAISVYRRHGFVEASRAPTLHMRGVVVMELAIDAVRRCA